MQTKTRRKRAYRYKVIGSTGSGTTAIGDSSFILDWKYYGREYTWKIWDLREQSLSGTITGEYVDRGYVDDDGYKSDRELRDERAVNRHDREVSPSS